MVAMAMPDPDRAETWGGKMIVDRQGAMIGVCTQVYTDDATGLPEWATARMGNLNVLVPLVDAAQDGEQVQVAVDRDEVLLAPIVADPLHISEDEEGRLYQHYGIAFSRDQSRTLLPASEGSPPSARTPLRNRITERRQVLVAAIAAAALAGLAGVLSALLRHRCAGAPAGSGSSGEIGPALRI
jgi:hypothetical protein